MNKKVYIVFLPSSHIGGAEKRFLELWAYMQSKGYDNIFMILNQKLFEKAKQIRSLNTDSSLDNIVVISTKSSRYRDFFVKILPIIISSPKDTVFHYPLMGIPLVHKFFRHKMIISMVNSLYFEEQETSLTFKSKMLFRINALFADKIDVLNPKIYNRMCQSFLLRKKLRLTVGSMVKEIPEISSKRRNKIIFLGRFDNKDPKNVLKYVESIPKINTYLISKKITDVIYYILGHGVLEDKLRSIISQQNYKGINIKLYFEPNPNNILKDSKVMLSLQKYENYPSRSLIEAMSLGVIPIITDVGESRLFENEDIIKYINENFDATLLAKVIYGILNHSNEDYYKKAKKLNAFIEKKHSIVRHTKYFLKLYGLSL